MDNTENIFGRVFERLQKDILNEKNGDYVNENDGLVYCGVCHSPKQQIIGKNWSIKVSCRI